MHAYNQSMEMKVTTPYGNVYGVAGLEEAQRILAKTELERDHEGCAECRGELSLDACMETVRAELAVYDDERADGLLSGDFTAREIELVARADAWVAVQVPVADPMADLESLLGI